MRTAALVGVVAALVAGAMLPVRGVDALITNFHLPESSLLMLVCAFGGTERVLAAYRHAVERRYRFYSYGDAMFIVRRDDFQKM